MPNTSRQGPDIAAVGITPTTPFTADLAHVDRGALRDNLRFLVDSGAALLYPAGNTGEAASLSPSEWTVVVETAVEVAGDRAAVLPGIAQELPTARDLARRAGTLGAVGLLLMPRTQPYASSGGMIAYWRSILDEASPPAVVYKRGLPDDGDLLEILADPRVIGCKYAGSDVSGFAAVVEAGPRTVTWSCGSAERFAPFFWTAGARGFTSGLANFAPGLAFQLQRALMAGDHGRALEVRSSCLAFEQVRARHGDAFNVAAVKAAMDSVGLAGGRVRPPLRDLDPRTESEVGDLARAMVETAPRGDPAAAQTLPTGRAGQTG